MTENDGRSCKGVKNDGSPCGAPGRLVDPETGFCDAHDPDKRDELRERGRRGGYRSTSPRKAALDLPPLVDLESAQVWAEEIARGVADGSVSASKGNALNRLLKTWLSSHENAEAERAVREARESEAFGPRAPGGDAD